MEHRGYAIESDQYGLKEIKPVGRGSVNKTLRGKFTHAELAQKAIDKFEDEKPKEKVNAKADSDS